MNSHVRSLAERAGFHFDEYNEPTQRKVESLVHMVVEDCIARVQGLKIAGVQDETDRYHLWNHALGHATLEIEDGFLKPDE